MLALCSLGLLLPGLVFGTSVIAPRAGTYHNPIRQGRGADPWMTQYNNSYYLTYSNGGVSVDVSKADNIAGPWPTNGTVVYAPKPTEKELWAPELHRIDGEWYIYVAIDDGSNNNHRMYVLKGTDSTNPLQPFTMVGQITSPDNNWAIDGTVLEYHNKLYLIWSGWYNASDIITQNLYIAPMDSPTHISGPRVLLHEPTPAWQKSYLGSTLQGVNEGPEILVHGNRTFLIYSAAGSWGDDYCLAIMGIDNNADPLVASNWWRNDTGPIFSRSSSAFGPGHASFLPDRNGTMYIVYHAVNQTGAGWAGRTIRTQSFTWNKDGTPNLGSPVGFNVELPLPA